MAKLAPKARNSNLVIQNLRNETLIYDLSNNKAYCLNETSIAVWHLSDGRRTTKQIASELSVSLNALVSEEFVLLVIDQLAKNQLLEDAYKPNEAFSRQSRRTVIKKAGFASLVALPVVSSLVAPTPSQAQSCLPTSNTNPGGASTCFSNSECCSGNCLNNSLCCEVGAIFPTNHTIECTVQGSCPTTDARCCGGTAFIFQNAPVCNGLNACVCN